MKPGPLRLLDHQHCYGVKNKIYPKVTSSCSKKRCVNPFHLIPYILVETYPIDPKQTTKIINS